MIRQEIEEVAGDVQEAKQGRYSGLTTKGRVYLAMALLVYKGLSEVAEAIRDAE